MADASRKPGSIGLDLFTPGSQLEELFKDLYSAASRNEGDFARVAWRVPTPGVVHLLAVERGNLPKGTAGQLIAEALSLSNTLPTKRLVVEEIINPPTIEAYAAGGDPESTVLGKTAISALDQMGLTPGRCSWDVARSTLRIVIDISEANWTFAFWWDGTAPHGPLGIRRSAPARPSSASGSRTVRSSCSPVKSSGTHVLEHWIFSTTATFSWDGVLMFDTWLVSQIVGISTLAALARWFAEHRRHLGLRGKLRAAYERSDRANLQRLAEARLQVSLLKKEIALLKSELSARQVREFRTSLQTMAKPAARRTHAEASPDRRRPEEANGFPDTEPWERGSP